MTFLYERFSGTYKKLRRSTISKLSSCNSASFTEIRKTVNQTTISLPRIFDDVKTVMYEYIC